MTTYNNQRTDRIDTTITEVAVRGGYDASDQSAAVRHVRKSFDDFGSVLAVWRTGERDSHGYPVYAVEWEAKDDDS